MPSEMPAPAAMQPWLTIIGLGEDGLAGLGQHARAALDAATLVFGAPRHLALADAGARGRPWPVPFDPAPVLAARGARVAVLASGDPFWFGAGGVLARHLRAEEWRAFPAPSCFGLAAARLGWRLEDTVCRGLHALPFEALTADLAPGAQLLVTLRDGAAAGALAAWLTAQGWGASRLWLMQALGGAREAVHVTRADDFASDGTTPIASPVIAAIKAQGAPGLPATPGLPDMLFAHDGQITKSPVRALTLAALAPRAGAYLWDLGAGSGSVSVEWCRAGGHATAIETRADRCANITENARRFGLGAGLRVVHGTTPLALAGLKAPDAVFVGGGFDRTLWEALRHAAPAARLVVNAVTIETQTLIAALHAAHGGTLLKLDLAHAAPLGVGRGWQPARTLLQWSLP